MAAPYVKQPWVDHSTPADAAHMNHIEDGIAAADDALTYRGDWAAGTYYDGDIVVGTDGFPYVCVKDGVTTAPVPFPGANGGIPLPVQNGKWVKGVGGAAVWAAITAADVSGLPGQQLDRVTNTVSSTNITATTVATANVICTGASLSYDGATMVEISFSTYAMLRGTTSTKVGVFDNGAEIGEIIHYLATVAGPAYGRTLYTPSAGSHQFSIRAYVDGGTGSMFAGPGGSGNPVPNEMIVRRV